MFTTALNTIVTWVGAIIAIIFVVFIVKDVIEIIKGQGSILKCLGKVIFVFIIIGIIFATKNYENFGNNFSNTAESAIDSIADESQDLF